MKRENIKNELDNIIELCNITISNCDNSNNCTENIPDIKNIVLPDLVELKKTLESNINTKIHLHSIWYILDHWSFNSKIGSKIIEFNNKYK
jgi:hypothetical protein